MKEDANFRARLLAGLIKIAWILAGFMTIQIALVIVLGGVRV